MVNYYKIIIRSEVMSKRTAYTAFGSNHTANTVSGLKRNADTELVSCRSTASRRIDTNLASAFGSNPTANTVSELKRTADAEFVSNRSTKQSRKILPTGFCNNSINTYRRSKTK